MGGFLLLKSSAPDALWYWDPRRHARFLVRDRACQDSRTRQPALAPDFTPVVPPLRTRLDPWEYDHRIYRRRNKIERLFRRLKGCRRIFSSLEKPDALFLGFILFALILRGVSLAFAGPSRFLRNSSMAATAS